MTGAAGDAQLVGFLRSRSKELVEFARALVATPSPNPPGDERAVAALVVEKLRELGVVRVETVASSEERPNVLAHAGGSGGRTLILCGHLDTKPPGELGEWCRDPYGASIEDGELHGVGSGDMKGAVAAMVFAAAALEDCGVDSGAVTLVLTADEEAGSRFGSQWLAETGRLAGDAALLGEPCGIVREWEAIDTVSRGAALFKVRVHGTQMHSSISDRLPSVNATVQMARLIDRMDRELLDRLRRPAAAADGPSPTVNVGVMARAGVFYGVYPGEAEFACDIRTVARDDAGAARGGHRELPAQRGGRRPGARRRARLRALGSRDRDRPGASSRLGAARGEPRSCSATSVPSASSPARPTRPISSSRPASRRWPRSGPGFLPRAHAPNESAPVAGILQAAELYALAARRYVEAS